MRLIDIRHDTSLAAGLIAGTIVVFQQPLRFLLNYAGEIQDRYRLDLIPALVVLSVVFVFHQYRKRQEMKAAAAAAEAAARLERLRAEELEQLVTLGRGLANALDFTALQHAVWRHLPDFLRPRSMWIVLRERGIWRLVVEDLDTAERLAPGTIENVAALAMARLTSSERPIAGPARVENYDCFPIGTGSTITGMLVMRDTYGALTEGQQRALDATLAFLGIAIRNVQLLLETREHSVRDSLTQWFTRGHGLERLKGELQRSRRTGAPLSVLMFDVDNFKQLNDVCGHQHGDAALVAITQQIDRMLRTTDVKCRYGGDEFLVILPDTPRDGAEQVAEHMVRAITALKLQSPAPISISVGVAVARPAEMDTEALIARADASLYRAKRNGRNCVDAEGDGLPIASGAGPRVLSLRP